MFGFRDTILPGEINILKERRHGRGIFEFQPGRINFILTILGFQWTNRNLKNMRARDLLIAIFFWVDSLLLIRYEIISH